MNNNRLYDAVPRKRQQEISTWWTITSILSALTVCIVMAITAYTLHRLHISRAEKNQWLVKSNPIHTLIAQNNQLKKEEETLGKQVRKLQAYSTGTQKTADAARSLLTHLRKTHAHLEALTLDKKTFELQCTFPEAQSAIILADSLAQDPAFQHVAIAALQNKRNTTTQQTTVTITGSLKRTKNSTAKPHPDNPAQIS